MGRDRAPPALGPERTLRCVGPKRARLRGRGPVKQVPSNTTTREKGLCLCSPSSDSPDYGPFLASQRPSEEITDRSARAIVPAGHELGERVLLGHAVEVHIGDCLAVQVKPAERDVV